MYTNSNLSLTVPPLMGIEAGVCTTPRTPEILNSLMAMTNPLEYSYPSAATTQANTTISAGVLAGSSANTASSQQVSQVSFQPLDIPPCTYIHMLKSQTNGRKTQWCAYRFSSCLTFHTTAI